MHIRSQAGDQEDMTGVISNHFAPPYAKIESFDSDTLVYHIWP